MKMRVFECAGKSYRMTRQRQAVLDVVRRANLRQDADWIYGEVRKVVPSISLGTVYRTLSLLREAGFITEVEAGGSTGYSVLNAGIRYQVTCTGCGRTAEAKIDVRENLEAQAAAATGFVITGHHLDFCGRCPDCVQKDDKGHS